MLILFIYTFTLSSGLYDLIPNLVLYKDGYGFDKTTGQGIVTVLLKGQTTLNPPTKDQYFGVIEQKINGFIDKVEAPKNLKGFGTIAKILR